MFSADFYPSKIQIYPNYCVELKRIYSKYWKKQVWANNVDPDQTPRNAASDQGLHCLLLIRLFILKIM